MKSWKTQLGAVLAMTVVFVAQAQSQYPRVLTEAHVAITPGKDFGPHDPERHIRIAYTQPVARLAEAVERIRRLVSR